MNNSEERDIGILFRLLIWLLPRHVRAEHGRELTQFIRLERSTGTKGMRLWLSVAADVARAAPGAHWDVARQDLAFAVRQFRRSPGFSAIAIITLALGIGGNAALFSVVNQVLFAPLRYAQGEDLLRLDEENEELGLELFGISPANFVDLTTDAESDLLGAAVWQTQSGTARFDGLPERVRYSAVSGGFFDVFVDPPHIGRVLTEADDHAGATDIVISHELWQTRFSGRPDVAGETLLVDGVAHRVVGVMPPGFDFPGAVDFWKPIGLTPSEWERRGARYLGTTLRLRPGVEVNVLQQRLSARSRALASEFADTNEGWTVRVRTLQEVAVGGVRRPILLLWAAAALIQLIAIANVAGLILGRAVKRRREMALRMAIGARSHRLIRQLISEGLLLAAISGAIGLALAMLFLRGLSQWATFAVPDVEGLGLNATSVAFTLVLIAATALLASIVPALLASRRDPANALREGGGMTRSAVAWQARLVVAEIALAVVVATCTTLLAQSMARIIEQPLGYEPAALTTFRIEPPFEFTPGSTQDETIARFHADRVRVANTYQRFMSAVTQRPDILGAGAVNRLPLTGEYWITGFTLPSQPDNDNLDSYVRVVTPGYLEALGTELRRGRGLLESDTQGSELVVLIDETFAQRHWRGSDPIGQSILLDGPPNEPRPAARIVGVVEAAHHNALDQDFRPTFYVTLSQALEGHGSNWGMDVVVRSRSGSVDPEVLKRLSGDFFPGVAVFRVRSMTSIVDGTLVDRREQTVLLATFTGLALLLTMVGVYGVLALSVNQRTREFGVRLALGARRSEIIWLVERRGLKWVVSGSLLGVLSSFFVVRYLDTLVYQTSLLDPVPLATGPILLALVALVGAAAPAIRATHTDPVSVLREE